MKRFQMTRRREGRQGPSTRENSLLSVHYRAGGGRAMTAGARLLAALSRRPRQLIRARNCENEPTASTWWTWLGRSQPMRSSIPKRAPVGLARTLH
jgi:hypothetical protein